MGDDMPDLAVMSRSELITTCPADAIDEIKEVSKYISFQNGGKGAVRDVIEQVMKAQGTW
jgi:3-deoxy-D-manno-octulosonate 8-phosphate phosphatase (KDO 8-P phosphatase)